MEIRDSILLHDLYVIAAMVPEPAEVESRNDTIARIAVQHAKSAIRAYERLTEG